REEADLCLKTNATLMLTAAISSQSCGPLAEVRVPYPYHGVFIRHAWNDDKTQQNRAVLQVWRPCLVPRPGLWFIRDKKKGQAPFRAEMGLGCTWRICEKDKKSKRRKYVSILARSAALEQINQLSAGLGGKVVSDLKDFLSAPAHGVLTEEDQQYLREILERVASSAEITAATQLHLYQSDLQYQRLYTYSVFLVENLAQMLAQTLSIEGGGARLSSSSLQSALRKADLTPLFLYRMTHPEGSVLLHPFTPLNGADAISELTSFCRYNMSSKSTKLHAPRGRQNHPSFDGIVCPVETPESDQVGITLHTAAGVETDGIGVPIVPRSPTHGLGYAAALLPFYHHNDAARSMMGAKNLVQAVPVVGAEAPLITTGHEDEIERALGPLREIGIAPEEKSFYLPGKNLLVAYMPWFGWNYEDAIVASRELVGPMAYTEVMDYSRFVPPGFRPSEHSGRYHADWCWSYHVTRMAENPPEEIPAGMPLAVFEKCGQPSFVITCPDDGKVISMEYHAPASPLQGGLLRWTMRRRYPLNAGDKLMGRHGNKGVISKLLDANELPCLPDDPRLGPLAGRPIDLVLNPHGVISRMNLGQLLETQEALLMRLGALGPDRAADGAPFHKVDLDDLRQRFTALNQGDEPNIVDQYGRMRLTLPDGTTTQLPVCVGYQYMVRLRHIAERKAHVRKGGRGARFDRKTGQAVGGKAAGGGQRIGEMEMWALFGYQAENILDYILTTPDPQAAVRSRDSQTFHAIVDHLFALGVKFQDEDPGKLRWSTDSDVETIGMEVISDKCWLPAVRGEFVCAKEKCHHRWHGSAGPAKITASQRNERTRVYSLSVGDVLRHHGLCPRVLTEETKPIPPQKKELIQHIGFRRHRQDAGSEAQIISFVIKVGVKSVSVRFSLGDSEYTAYRQTKPFRISDLPNLSISCPRHTTVAMKCSSHENASQPAPCGLAEPAIFSGIESNSTGYTSLSWGYIRLPFSIPHPLNGSVDSPPVSVVPVVPLAYRCSQPDPQDSARQYDPFTPLYQELLEMIHGYHSDSDHEDELQKTISIGVDKIYKAIAESLFKKEGLIRREGVGRRVDASAHFVIVPNPNLKWDECRIPLEAFIELFVSEVAEWAELDQGESRDDTADGDDCDTLTPEDLQTILQYKWPQKIMDHQLRLVVTKLCDDYISAEHPMCLVNRYPTLHRYNIKALRPLVPPVVAELPAHQDMGSALVLEISPLLCSSMGADFDGDEMYITKLPPPLELGLSARGFMRAPLIDGKIDTAWTGTIENEAVSEIDRLRPTHQSNLLSLADRSPVASFDQDFVLGHFWISMDEALRRQFRMEIAFEQCRVCNDILGSDRWDKGAGRKFLQHLCREHAFEAPRRIESWMRLAFDAVTRAGISFGALELQACQPTCAGVDNEEMQKHVQCRLHEIVADAPSDTPGWSFAAMASCGARGTDQARQILGARGWLSPGATDFKCRDKDFGFSVSLLEGMTQPISFMAAMNGRSSMVDKQLGTGKAGGLTRDLVVACWPWRVGTRDCGLTDERRTPANCKLGGVREVCSACYGILPDGTEALQGFPAGLIAAQAIGERGTQLTLQSFHTGKQLSNIGSVIKVLNSCDHFLQADGQEEFLKILKGAPAYRHLDDRHLLLLWRVIHESEKMTLRSAIDQSIRGDLFTGLVGPAQWKFIQTAIQEGRGTSSVGSGWGRILTGRRRLPTPDDARP
ncbi:MAG: hypothetical protein HN341_01155, partial [Verrucomicrobia bacterium]|nr:hypothetical protein [Verrucomicrobiota bacterium]